MMKRAIVWLFVCLLALAPHAAAAEEYLLLRGDLHCHTAFSRDSVLPLEDALAHLTGLGYDFVALTEHDTVEHLSADLSAEDILVLPGIEMSYLGGHYNVYGLRDLRLRGNMAKKGLESYLQSLSERGALVQINHPNVASFFSNYGYLPVIDMVEVVNSSVSADDYQTLRDWQALLCEGRKIVATAGSDAHSNIAHKCVNHVFAKERTIEGVLEAIGAGRLYITVARDNPAMHIVCDGRVMGQTVARREHQYAGLALSGIPLFSDVYIYTNKGLYSRQAASGTYSIAIPTADFTFIRCEVWNHGEGLIALSNPLYIE